MPVEPSASSQPDVNPRGVIPPDVNPLLDGLAEPDVQARLAAIIESSDDAIISKTLKGIIQSWNTGAERIFGYTAAEAVGQSINMIIPPERRDEEPEILRRLQRGERVDHFQTVRMTKDNRRIDISVTISPVKDSRGRIVAASKIARDVTLQKRYEKELREAKEAAEAATKAKDRFISILSHELRTPLTPVLAELSVLEMEAALPAELRERLGMIRRNVELEARLVDDLLDLTRLGRGRIRLEFGIVDAHQAIRNVLSILQSEIEGKSLELTLALRAKKHHVWADFGRLQQIFLNLLSNAVKFTPENGSISIRSINEGTESLRVEIIDSGMGIEASMIPRLFKSFEQSETAQTFGGLGVGLTIAKNLVELHSGSITALSEGADRGATFTVTLATVAHAEPASTPPSVITPSSPGKTVCNVLLVEDHADTREVMARLLKSFGCKVTAAGTVAEAMAASDVTEFDLLISDIGLPDGTGLDVMRQMKLRGNIRGIALSGYGQEEDLQRSRDAGFETHLTKPVNFNTLMDVIRKGKPLNSA